MTKTELLFGLPIELTHGLGVIYQPKLRDFFTHSYGKFVRSFSMRTEMIFDEDKIPYEDMENFDIFFLFLVFAKDNPDLVDFIEELIDSLSLLYKCDIRDIKIKENPNKEGMDKFYIDIQDKYILDRNNYDYLCVSVMNMLDNEIQVNENGEMSEIEKKIAKARAKFEREHKKYEEEKKEDGYDIFDLVNYILHVNGTVYTYESIQELTIYQIKNTCKLYQQKESYELFMEYKTSGQFEIKEERPHWFFNKK